VTFKEGHVDADGFRIRYCEAGAGEPLVVLHGAGGLRISPSHELLAESQRVILLETPGFGESPVNDRSGSMKELAMTMAAAISALGVERFNLMGNSFGGKLASWLAVQQPERVLSLVLAAPATIRPEGPPPQVSPEERMGLMYAHPERLPRTPPPSPEVLAKQEALVQRLMGPAREEELESRLAELNVAVLVLIGTRDRVIPPTMGRIYREKLPNCHFELLYDAAHALDVDRPEAFAKVVADFIVRRESFIVNQQSALINP
jgi:pimeloyl-ACP methyl ester carboxylesterase